MSKHLEKFNNKNFAIKKKNRTFADDDNNEPTALATSVGKAVPILSGESARIFLERAREAEEEAEKRKNEPPSLQSLKDLLAYNKMQLKQDINNVKERCKIIRELNDKIDKLEKENGKTNEE